MNDDTTMVPRTCPNGGSTPLPAGKQWVGHTGRRQQLRELKKAWRRFEKETKANAVLLVLREDLLDAVTEAVPEGDEELSCMIAVMGARVKALETGKRFEDILQRAIDDLRSTPRVAKSWSPDHAKA